MLVKVVRIIIWIVVLLVGGYFIGALCESSPEYDRKARSRNRRYREYDYDDNYVLLDDLYSADYNKIDGFDSGDDGDY